MIKDTMYITGLKDQDLWLFCQDREGSTRPRDIEELEIANNERLRRFNSNKEKS